MIGIKAACLCWLFWTHRWVTHCQQFNLMQISTYKLALFLPKYSLIESTHMHKIIHIFRLSYLSPTKTPLQLWALCVTTQLSRGTEWNTKTDGFGKEKLFIALVVCNLDLQITKKRGELQRKKGLRMLLK